jgi:polyphenol oxidase
MQISINKNIRVFMGDATTLPLNIQSPELEQYCDKLRKKLQLEYLVFQDQSHGTNGWIITTKEQLTQPTICFDREGDYLITDQPNIGIGVRTADCLPIVFYAEKHNVIAVAHAGWRGSVAGIGPIVVKRLQQEFSIQPHEIHALFGPAAKLCCYQVTQEFRAHLSPFAYKDRLITERNGKLFFNNSLLNQLQLEAAGIPAANINQSYNHCTICNTQYHSYRRATNKENYCVQPTIVWLKK